MPSCFRRPCCSEHWWHSPVQTSCWLFAWHVGALQVANLQVSETRENSLNFHQFPMMSMNRRFVWSCFHWSCFSFLGYVCCAVRMKLLQMNVQRIWIACARLITLIKRWFSQISRTCFSFTLFHLFLFQVSWSAWPSSVSLQHPQSVKKRACLMHVMPRCRQHPWLAGWLRPQQALVDVCAFLESVTLARPGWEDNYLWRYVRWWFMQNHLCYKCSLLVHLII